MAGENRTPSHFLELLEQLQREPYAFDFFQAVRLLDCAHPDQPQTGFSRRVSEDPIRLGQEPSTIFAPSTLADLEPATDFHPPRLIERFMGLLGPQGPLPSHLTEYAQSRINHHGDPTFYRFLDLFHHRMVSLFYRAWARVRPTVNFDVGSHDRFGEYVGAIFGLGMRSLMDRDALPDRPKLHFSGLFSCQTRHAEGLLAILRGYFRLPVELEQFVGQWIELPDDCQCRTGLSSATSSLGQTIAIGSHIWDCQQKFRVILGPLDLADYYQMLPANVEVAKPDIDREETTRPARMPVVADAVYLNGKIFAEGKRGPRWVEALAVKNGKFLAVGKNFDVAPFKAANTKLIDLGGAMVLPECFVDPARANAATSIGLQVSHPDASDLDEIKAAIRTAAGTAPAGTWIQSGNWRPSNLSVGPPRALLDALAPDHPVCLRDAAGTTAWVNTIAMELAQIADATPNPAGGAIVRHQETGDAIGVLQGTAIALVDAAIAAAAAQRPLAVDRWQILESRVRRTLQRHGIESQGNQAGGRLALEEALVEQLQAARATSTTDGSGSIQPGRYADMIVIDQDLCELVDRGQIDRIHQTRVLQAIFDGDVAHPAMTNRLASPNESFARPARTRKSDGIADDPHVEPSSLADSPVSAARRRQEATRKSDASGHASLDSLVALLRSYVGDHLQWDLQLILKRHDTPPLGLGLQGHLGWSTWLLREPLAEDPADLILDAMAAQRAAGTHVVEGLRYEVIRNWDHQILGQTRDGEFVRSTTRA